MQFGYVAARTGTSSSVIRLYDEAPGYVKGP